MQTVLATAALAWPAFAADRLAAVHADPARTSVSGLSSGAFMAVQYEVAFSASTIGVGVVAGGPYNCAYLNLFRIDIPSCMIGWPLPPSAAMSRRAAIYFANHRLIDPVGNLARHKVYLFSGTNDAIVRQPVMDSVRDFYTSSGVPKASLLYVRNMAAGHAFLSPFAGNACNATEAPFVNECSVSRAPYDQPGAILNQIYGPLNPKAQTLSPQTVAFDQTEFAPASAGMADTGQVYIPTSCQQNTNAKCAVHVVFHGCKQGAGEVQDAVYGKVGYNQWADTNGIIVLYPQVDPTSLPINPEGCWDWFGYTGFDFQVRSGKQLSAVHAMVNRLTGQ